MSNLPDYVRVNISDCAEELRLFKGHVERISIKHKNSDPDLVKALYSLDVICRELRESLEAVVNHIDKNKTTK